MKESCRRLDPRYAQKRSMIVISAKRGGGQKQTLTNSVSYLSHVSTFPIDTERFNNRLIFSSYTTSSAP